MKTKFGTVVLFLTVGKVDQNVCSWAKNILDLAGRLVLNLLAFISYLLSGNDNHLLRISKLLDATESTLRIADIFLKLLRFSGEVT